MPDLSSDIQIRTPTAADGAAVFKLVNECPPLDSNSMYCNLLQCSHFANTSVAAEVQGTLVGFISAYLVPDRPNVLFVWQVAVGEPARGRGLATHMLKHILNRPQCHQVNYLETTVTESNQASWALFQGLAKKLGCKLKKSVMFDQQQHFDGQHDSEILARLGPFTVRQI